MRISDWSSDVCSSDLARTARGKRAKPAKDVSELPPGRESFAPVQATRRSNPRRRNVRPDPIDLRDWMYQPSIAVAPRDWMLPNDPRRTKHQHRTNACTGFALSTAIKYLLDRGQRPCEPISGYMLYSMARRYAEWAEDDDVDSGSSLRGPRSEEPTSELQSLMRTSYAVFCLKQTNVANSEL